MGNLILACMLFKESANSYSLGKLCDQIKKMSSTYVFIIRRQTVLIVMSDTQMLAGRDPQLETRETPLKRHQFVHKNRLSLLARSLWHEQMHVQMQEICMCCNWIFPLGPLYSRYFFLHKDKLNVTKMHMLS